MGRYLVTIGWSVVYTLIVGFIAAPLTQHVFNAGEAVIVGVIFGFIFAAVVPILDTHYKKGENN